jgi:broad specificity phosphatase PhoE
MYFGSWEGLTWQEVEARFPEDAKAWAESFPHHRPPKGESYSELQTRAILELESLLRTAESECSLVVTHAGLIRAFIGWVLGIADQRITSLAQDYGSISVIKQVGDHWSVAALNLNPSLFAHINKDRNNCL